MSLHVCRRESGLPLDTFIVMWELVCRFSRLSLSQHTLSEWSLSVLGFDAGNAAVTMQLVFVSNIECETGAGGSHWTIGSEIY